MIRENSHIGYIFLYFFKIWGVLISMKTPYQGMFKTPSFMKVNKFWQKRRKTGWSHKETFLGFLEFDDLPVLPKLLLRLWDTRSSKGQTKKILPNNNSSITVPIAVGKKDWRSWNGVFFINTNTHKTTIFFSVFRPRTGTPPLCSLKWWTTTQRNWTQTRSPTISGSGSCWLQVSVGLGGRHALGSYRR